nr:glycoside hydrolase family 10 protein [Aphanothece hegewaldii]
MSLESPKLLSFPVSQSSELRGVWLTNIDSDILFSEQKLSDSIVTLKELNFNTLYPTVWNWGYTLYPSKVAKQAIGIEIDPTESLQKRDILQEILDQGHRKRMTVIPWFEFGFMAPADSELAKRHPEWLTQRKDKSTIWLEGKVHQRVWLNPLDSNVQKFITDLVLELIDNYDVDGIQFDDHFGYPSDFGYDPLTVQLYQQEHQGKLPPTNHLDKDWIQWRADKITEYMEQLVQTIRLRTSKVIISVSPNPQAFSLESYLADWHKWEKKGLIDELVIQVYRSKKEDYLRELQSKELQIAKARIPVGIGILAGLKGRPVNRKNITEQVTIARENGFAGVSFFFYESLWNMADEPAEKRRTLFKDLFPTSAIHPNIIRGWSPQASKG